MPFKSAKQRSYLYSKKPEVAEKFAEHGNMEMPMMKKPMKKKKMKDMMRRHK